MPSFSDIFFSIFERSGDEEDDEDQGNSDWVTELQALEGKLINEW